MSITVTPNSDGSITIQCGADSVTIGAPTLPKQTTSPDIPILWPPSGATASIVAEGQARTIAVPVPSANQLAQAIRDQHGLNSDEHKKTIFQFNVQGFEPLSIEELNNVLFDLGNPEWMGTQIRLTGDRDE